jgi:hypothetical protein
MTKPNGEAFHLPEIPKAERSNASDSLLLDAALRRWGPEAVRKIVNGLQTIRFGSIVLTVHEGEVVEISTTVRVRPSSAPDNSKQ